MAPMSRATAEAGVVTPDHTIRTKNWPLLVSAPQDGETDEFKRQAAAAVAAFHRGLPGLFRPQQYARRRDQADARPPAPRGAGARSRPVRPRALQEGREGRRRPGRGGDRDHHGCRSDRPLRVDLRGRHVRCRVLVARAGQARQRQGAAARRPDRGDHRRRRRDRRPPPPRRSRRRAPRSRCSMSTRARRARLRPPSAAARSRSPAT